MGRSAFGFTAFGRGSVNDGNVKVKSMNVSFRDVVPGDAIDLAHILVTSNSIAFRGLVPDYILDYPETESATNWQRTLAEGLRVQDFMVLAVVDGGVLGTPGLARAKATFCIKVS